MVESFAPSDSMASCSDYSEQEVTETLLDHYVGAVRITGVNWCETLGVISLSLGDGSI